MLYLYQGHICVTAGGQTVPQFKEVMMEFSKEWQLAQVMTYIFFVFTKTDNPYWSLPPKERRMMVIDQYGLFKEWGKKITWSDIESNERISKFIDFYKKICLSDNDINEEAFREKAEYWRRMLLKDNSPEEEEKIYKALVNATKMAEEYKVKGMIEAGNEGSEGHPLYLFEVPEDKKDHHLRLNLY